MPQRHSREIIKCAHGLFQSVQYLQFSAGLMKGNGAKFSELSLNVPKLAVHGQAKLPGSTGANNFKQGDFILRDPVFNNACARAEVVFGNKHIL